MFSVGMKVGPQFLAGLKRDAGKFFFFGLFMPVAAIGLMLAMRALMPLAPGLVARHPGGQQHRDAGPGRGAGGLRGDARGEPDGRRLANLSTSFAFAYCLSTVLFVLLLEAARSARARHARARHASSRRDLRESSSAPLPGTADEFIGGPLPVARRSYQLEKPQAVGHRLGELRRTYPLVAIERVLRGGQLLEPSDDMVLQPHDTLALYGRVPRLLNAASVIGPEVDVPELRRHRVARPSTSSCTAPAAVGQDDRWTLASDVGHGLYLNAMFRGGVADPVGARHRRPARRRPARHRQPLAHQDPGGAHGARRPRQRQHRHRDAGAGVSAGSLLGAMHDPDRRPEADARLGRRAAAGRHRAQHAAHAPARRSGAPFPSRRASCSRTWASTSSSSSWA